MEDAKIINLALDDSTMIFGIFDGHGGHEVSQFVSRRFTFHLLNSPGYSACDLESALMSTFNSMDDLIRSEEGSHELFRISKNLPYNFPVNSKNFRHNVGCTALVSVIRGKEIFVANAGDSRCVLSRNGQALDLSLDHKPTLYKERIRIISAGGRIIDGRINQGLNLTRSLGDLAYKSNKNLPANQQLIISEPEIQKIEIQETDKFMVLACDGIWEVVSSQECVDFIDKRIHNQTLSSIAEELLDACLAPKVSNGIGCDNMTIIIIAFKNSINL